MTTEILSPELTAYDKRVLNALQWTGDRHPFGDDPLDWRNIWQVGACLREYDLATLRRTLDGLAHLGHAMAGGFDHRRVWVATPWRHAVVRQEGR